MQILSPNSTKYVLPCKKTAFGYSSSVVTIRLIRHIMSEKSADNSVRVLIVSQLFPPESMGGAYRWQKLSRNLPDDVEPHVLTPPSIVPLGTFERSSRLWESEEIAGIPVTRLWTYQPTDNDWTGLGRILNFTVFALFASLYVLAYWWRYDCIVTSIGPHPTLLPGLVGRIFGRSWIVDIDDMWIDNAADLGFVTRDSLAHRTVEGLERYAFALADEVIVITETMANQYAEKYGCQPEMFAVIPSGIDVDAFAPAADTGVTAADNDTAAGERPIVYTGKLGQGQSFEPFFRGFARLDDPPELRIVGFGDRREELEQLSQQLDIAERVSFEGPVDREAIPAILQSAALAWVPLKTEHSLDYACPTKLLETMAAGTPYIASQVAEIDAVTAASGAGRAVANDPDAVAAAMSELLADEARRVETGQCGTAFVAENHRWSVLGERAGRVIRAATSSD
jgi:glycosyltransferase involved in cell wall biosynthesis